MKKNKIAVLIPCYNEAATIKKVVNDYKKALPDADIYVFDNNSTDETVKFALSAGAIVEHEYRQGKGNVIRTMFRKIDADCYLMIDGDDTYPAEDAKAMCDLILEGKADMVVGDRLSSTYFQENKRPFHNLGNKLVRFLINKLFKNDSSGHDISHLIRTMNIALNLCKKENGDELIVGISAFMHDIHRIMQNETGKFVSPKDSLPKVREILSNTDLSEEIINKICYCIEYHEIYNWNGNNIDDINTLILQDADNLDAIGAIGIGRTFSYGGAHNVKMYDENSPLETLEKYSEEKGDDPSTIHHFYHKLFKLADNMNTKSAKEQAKYRTEYMKNFVNEFLEEWNGVK